MWTYWLAGNSKCHSIRRHTALIPSSHTSGNRPPMAPATAKPSIASQSRPPPGALRRPMTTNAANNSTPESRSACCMAVA